MKFYIFFLTIGVSIQSLIPNDKLIGTWLYSDEDDTVELTLKHNGEFLYKAHFEGSSEDTLRLEGNYSVVESILTISPKNEEAESYEIIRIEKDTFELRYQIQTYLFIKQN